VFGGHFCVVILHGRILLFPASAPKFHLTPQFCCEPCQCVAVVPPHLLRRVREEFSGMPLHSVTHTLFYMYDFAGGNNPFGQTETSRVLVVLQSILVHSWRIHNWDVMGEVLAGMACLGVGGEDQFVREAETAYLKSYRPDGTIPPNRMVKRSQRKLLVRSKTDSE
jgi:hypothetical protein